MAKPSRKQAVLLIHGIGEQRPMDTLRSFAKAAWSTDVNLHKKYKGADAMWSKPYPLSEDFELRRFTTPENRAGLRTDFFELYWAHLMFGTRLRHLLAWARTLLLRWPPSVPSQLKPVYWLLISLIAFGLAMAYGFWSTEKDGGIIPPWLSATLGAFVIPAIVGILLNTVGDAARYLHVAPENVQRRHEIRAAGVRVLKSLHERGYDRIVVVGHSLGSVIGYDILNYAWSAYNAEKPKSASPSHIALDALEDLAAKGIADNVISCAQFHKLQRAFFEEMKANENPWRVTDFITIGSPLTHAEILLARDAADLQPKFVARELPKSPPELEETTHKNVPLRRFSYPASSSQRVPHHAAVFAPTRWTNIYSPSRFIVKGDMIGGPLRTIFGAGVLDKAVNISGRLGFLTHTLYWAPVGDQSHLLEFRRALDLLDGWVPGNVQEAEAA